MVIMKSRLLKKIGGIKMFYYFDVNIQFFFELSFNTIKCSFSQFRPPLEI